MIARLISVAALALLVVTAFVGCRSQSGTATLNVSADQAKTIALNDAGLDAQSVTWLHAEPDRDNGVVYYDVSFRHGDTEYEYDIDAVSGQILQKDMDTQTTVATTAPSTAADPTPTTAALITAAQAQITALTDAGLSADQVTQLYVHSEHDDGRSYFDVSFLYEHKEYDYEIDAVSGGIVEKDIEPID